MERFRNASHDDIQKLLVLSLVLSSQFSPICDPLYFGTYVID